MMFGSSCLLFLLFQLVTPQAPPACVQDITQKPGFSECMSGFMTFLGNAGEAAGGAPGGAAGNHDEMAMMKLMCSDQGKAALGCMIEYMKECPEIMQQTGGMDLSAFMKQGGLDATCSILVGQCAAVQQCLHGDGSGEMNISAMLGMNPFPAFLMEASMICGPMREKYDCIVQHVDKCKDEVANIEAMLKTSLEMSLQNDHAFGSYDDMKKFMNEDCKKVTAKMGEDQCLQKSLGSSEFTDCYSNSMNAYTMKKDDKCALYDLQSVCLDTHVAECGKEKTDFMKSNMHRIIKNVPASCTLKDTSGAVRNVQLATTSIVMLAVSVFLVL